MGGVNSGFGEPRWARFGLKITHALASSPFSGVTWTVPFGIGIGIGLA